MPITKNNFAINLNNEFEGVDVAFLTVDFINSMAAETEDLSDSSSTKAGLELVERTKDWLLSFPGDSLSSKKHCTCLFQN